jgi:hypothetical protein
MGGLRHLPVIAFRTQKRIFAQETTAHGSGHWAQKKNISAAIILSFTLRPEP